MWIPPAYSPIRPLSLVESLFPGGSVVSELEARLGEWYGAERALATGSGTQALQLALKASLESTGGPGTIALPAYNCFDVVSSAVWVGAPVVFYDIDPLTLAPDQESLSAAVDEADVLVVANLYGFPLNWDLIRGLADKKGIPVVEDAAQGLGASWKGQAAGTSGDFSVLSFGRGKGWTGGSGGAVLMRGMNGNLLPKSLPDSSVSRFPEAAKMAATWLMARPALYGIPARIPSLGLGETQYRPPVSPHRISSYAAALVLKHRRISVGQVILRREVAGRLKTAVRAAGIPVSIPCPVPGGESGDLRFPLLWGGSTRELRQAGRYAGYPQALPALAASKHLCGDCGVPPGTQRLVNELCTLPTHSRGGSGALAGMRAFGGEPERRSE